MTTIEANGTKWLVLESKTADDYEKEGKPNTARRMRDLRATRKMLVRRPRGKKLYFLSEYASPVGGHLFFGDASAV